jgi:hypothetical protein
MDLSEWDACPERDRLLKDKNIALGQYAERAFALFQDASRDCHLYRQLLNEATKAQYAAQKAGAAFTKHIEFDQGRSWVDRRCSTFRLRAILPGKARRSDHSRSEWRC